MTVLPLRLAVSLSQQSTAFAQKLVVENRSMSPVVMVLIIMLGLIAALWVAVSIFNVDGTPDDRSKDSLTSAQRRSPQQNSGRAPAKQSPGATSGQIFSGRRSPLMGSPRIPGTMSTPAPMGSAAQHLEQRVKAHDSPIISPNVES